MEPARKEDNFMVLEGGKKIYTVADIEALPEGDRAELIDGEMFIMETPITIHQELLIELAIAIKLYIKNRKGNCRVIPAPYGVYIKNDNHNFVEPDISVICDRDKIDRKGCHGAPDWVIEILSPSSLQMDCKRKVRLYQEAGVREYWIVDPDAETVTVYDFEHEKEPEKYAFSERVKAGIFEELYIHISELDLG